MGEVASNMEKMSTMTLEDELESQELVSKNSAEKDLFYRNLFQNQDEEEDEDEEENDDFFTDYNDFESNYDDDDDFDDY